MNLNILYLTEKLLLKNHIQIGIVKGNGECVMVCDWRLTVN